MITDVGGQGSLGVGSQVLVSRGRTLGRPLRTQLFEFHAHRSRVVGVDRRRFAVAITAHACHVNDLEFSDS